MDERGQARREVASLFFGEVLDGRLSPSTSVAGVDNANVAGWLSGTRALRGAVARPELRAERRELLETLELLIACGGMTPSTTGWCH